MVEYRFQPLAVDHETLAVMLCVSETKVRAMVRAGQLPEPMDFAAPTARARSCPRFLVSEVLTYLEASRPGHTLPGKRRVKTIQRDIETE